MSHVSGEQDNVMGHRFHKYRSSMSLVSIMLLLIIKTRPICMFGYMSHTIYLCIQVERGWLLKTDGDRRTMLRMGPVHSRDNGPGVSGT